MSVWNNDWEIMILNIKVLNSYDIQHGWTYIFIINLLLIL